MKEKIYVLVLEKELSYLHQAALSVSAKILK